MHTVGSEMLNKMKQEADGFKISRSRKWTTTISGQTSLHLNAFDNEHNLSSKKFLGKFRTELRTPPLGLNKINNKLTGCRLDCYIRKNFIWFGTA